MRLHIISEESSSIDDLLDKKNNQDGKIDQNKNKVSMFSENELFTKWNLNNKKYSLLNYILPTEDLDDFRLIKQNINILEKKH